VTTLLATVELLAERMRARKAPPDGPRVLVLPALGASSLGRRGSPRDEVVWIDVRKIREGHLLDLAYDGPQLEALDLFEPLYLQMILRLRLAGYDVGTHSFDWRRPIRNLGEELSARIRAEGREVHLVTHSLGGLVARAAAMVGTPNLGKVIMMGPPNHGSLAAVQGIRGNHWVLHGLAALDGCHGAAELSAKVFGTWPSMYEQFPVRATAAGFDLFDPDQWPAEGLHPRRELLLGAPPLHAWLAAATGQFHVIAGHGLPTAEYVEIRDDALHYRRSSGGDGFVAASSAQLEGYPCYHVHSAHVGMPNHNVVIGAVEDILARGTTDRLSQIAPPSAPRPPFTERDVTEPPFQGRRSSEISAGDVRAALEELAGFVLPMP
jgi:pimeloyl-ACP methyl ester carboxylesterase